jgi:ferric-dicitrate binding protein FerR (iron transport regulator)
MVQHELYDLFAKKESGTIADEELIKLGLLLKLPRNKELYNNFKKVVDERSNLNMPKFNYWKSKEKVIAEIRKYEPGFTMGPKKKTRNLVFYHWISRIAAILIIAITIGSVLYVQQIKEDGKEPSIGYQYFSTKPGENLKLTLPDGSFIQLNGGSSIRFTEHLSGMKREVEITGEAYCKVAKDKKRPFIVTLGDYKIEVLGTTFNVNDYKEDQYLTVALVEGKVTVHRNQGGNVLLEPGKMVSFNKATHEHVQTGFDVRDLIGWKDKIFEFDNTPLIEVIKKIERRYGVTFETPGTDLSRFRINAKFDNDKLQTIMKAIEYGTGLTCTIQNTNHVKLSNP